MSKEQREYIRSSLPAGSHRTFSPVLLARDGTIQASFETTWGTSGSENPFEEGSADISIEMPDWNPTFLNSGATAGFTAEEGQANSSLLLAGYSEDNILLYPYLEFDHLLAVEGSLSIDQVTTYGSLYYTTEELGYSPVFAGYMYGGRVDFERFEATEGEVIRGTLSTSIYNWQPVSSPDED